MSLNQNQQLFFESIKDGKNVFLTGEAGTGKSFCIKELLRRLALGTTAYGITATTGIAALNIGGSTIHSWMGVGLAQEDADFLVTRIRKMKPIREKIYRTKILVIDEVSMLDADFLDKIDYILRKIKGGSRPFGGMRMIFTGDFLQLPPVSKGSSAKFAFKSDAWKNGNVQKIELTEQVRQKDDHNFAGMMGKVRKGDQNAARELLNDNNIVFPDDGIKPITLYCLNKLVDFHNEGEMAKLPGVQKTYYSQTSGDAKNKESLEKSCPVPPVLKLKVGAQVILLKNLDQEMGLVNGSLGVVVSLANESVVVKFESGEQDLSRAVWELKKQSVSDEGKTEFKVAASISQIPLKLAYSISVHKSQGLTLSRVILDATGAFDHGMIYVALSRVEKRKNLIVKNLNIHRITAHPKALAFYGYGGLVSQNEDPFDF